VTSVWPGLWWDMGYGPSAMKGFFGGRPGAATAGNARRAVAVRVIRKG